MRFLLKNRFTIHGINCEIALMSVYGYAYIRCLDDVCEYCGKTITKGQIFTLLTEKELFKINQ